MAQLLVVGLVAAVLVVVVGLAVWQSQNVKSNTAGSSPTTSPTNQASSTPIVTPSPANEFKVAELGFKMTLPTAIADAKYFAKTNLPGSAAHPATYSTSSFTTTSLEQQDSRCSASANSIGSIARYSEDPSSFATVAAVRKVGSFYLAFITPKQPCSDKAAAEQLQSSQTTLLRQAFDSATAL
jgi:hypothetical protein